MAGPYRVTYIFQSETGQGWSESYYLLSASTIDNAAPFADTLGKRRGLLVGKGSFLATWKIVDTANPRFSLPRDGTQGVFPSAKQITDNPVSSILAYASCAPLAGRRQVWMRGIPDEWVVFDTTVGQYVLDPAFLSAFRSFKTALTIGQWALRVGSPTVSTAAKGAVTKVVVNAINGQTDLFLAAGQTVDPTKNIIVGGFRYPLQHLNGTYLYPTGFTMTTNIVTLTQRTISANNASTYNSGGFVRNQTKAYNPITDLAYERPGDRKVGRVIGVPRGRRSAK